MVIDLTILVSLVMLAATQMQGTEENTTSMAKIIDYSDMHRNSTLYYHTSSTILRIQSNESYLSDIKVISCTGGNF